MTFNSPQRVITIKLEKDRFNIYCSFHMNNLIRNLPNRRWDKRRGCWVAPALRRNAEAIEGLMASRGIRVEISEEARGKIAAIRDRAEVVKHRERFPAWYKYKTEPKPHQVEALDSSYAIDTFGYLMDMGTGKSKTWIDRAACAFMEGKINAVLVLCPSTLRHNWVEQFDIHCPVSYRCFVHGTGTTDKNRDQIIKHNKPGELKVLIASIEGLQVKEKGGKLYDFIHRFLLSHNVEWAIDESHNIKGHGSIRAANCVHLKNLCKRRAILTGTAMSQGPTDLFMQFEFLNPDIIGVGDFYSFRNRYCIMGGFKDKNIVGYDNLEELTDLIKPWIYQITKDEALDLPEKMYQVRYLKMSIEQSSLYTQMAKKSIMAIKGDKGEDIKVKAENALTEYSILQQICGGFNYWREKVEDPITGLMVSKQHTNEIVAPNKNPKISEIVNIAKDNPAKSIIIWARFVYEADAIKRVLEDEFGPGCCSVYNSTTKDTHEQQKEDFLTKKTRFFISSQASGGSGLTLNVSDLTIYYSNTDKYKDRAQSEDRNHRIGQKNSVMYIDLVYEDTVERNIIESVKNKKDLIDYIREKLADNDIEGLFK